MKTTQQTQTQPITNCWQITQTIRFNASRKCATETLRDGIPYSAAVAILDDEQRVWEEEERSDENYAAAWENEDIRVERTYPTQLLVYSQRTLIIYNAIERR